MSYFIPKHRVPCNTSLTLSEGHLPTVVDEFMPFCYVERFAEKGTADIWGISTELIFNGAQYARLKVSLVNEKNVGAGKSIGNGSFPPESAFGLLENAGAIAYANPGIAELERFAVADPMEILVTFFTLLTWKPQNLINPFAFVLAFTSGVWLVFGITLVFLAALSAFADRFLTPWKSPSQNYGFGFYLWDFFSRLFPRGQMRRRDTWIRIIMASFVLPLSVLFMTILNSELTSTMLITKTTPTVNSYEDILLFKNVKIYTEKNTVLHTMLSEARSELFQRLKPRVAPVEGIFIQTPNTYKLLSAVEQQRGVIVVNVDMAHNLIVTAHRKWHRCPHLQVAREQAGLLLANVFLSRKIPDRTRRKLRKGFRATHEGGFLTKALEWTRRDSSACLSRSDNELKPMTFNQLEGSFMVLAIGGVSSLLSLLIEVAWAKDLHRSCCSSRSGRVLCRALAKANISRLNTLK